MFYGLIGLIQSNNSAYSSNLIISSQIEQKHSFNIWTERQKNKFLNFKRKHFDWCSQK